MTANATNLDSPVLLWFRKDLRLDDNLALNAAVASGHPVLAVYILEPKDSGNGPQGAAQGWWLHHSLEALSRSLDAKGVRLILRRGDAATQLMSLIDETGAYMVLWNRRYDPAGIAVDTDLKANLTERGLEVHTFAGQLLHEPSKLKTGSGTHYKVYTPFWRALEASGEPAEPLDPPADIHPPRSYPHSDTLSDWALLPTKPNWASTFSEIWEPGEQAALQKLEDFIDKNVQDYKTRRDIPSVDGTSRMSPHLAMGEISPARIWYATRGLVTDSDSADVITYRKELVWREFSYHLLFHNPTLPSVNLNRKFDTFPWSGSDAEFTAWCHGRTGYPIVDAGMRQLWRHGYMHNRVRMITASFLIKDLLIDWRRGLDWFADTLVDADPASNAASWQWVAGSGADASPFFRVFNPILQGEKFDPDGTYVKTFIPELANLDSKYVHRPFEAPAAVLTKAGVTLGTTYPAPIVNHSMARDRALDVFKTIKDAV